MSEPHTYVKYPNRRLYDRVKAQYVTLGEVRADIEAGTQVLVLAHRTQTDLTRETLLDILRIRELQKPTFTVVELQELIRR